MMVEFYAMTFRLSEKLINQWPKPPPHISQCSNGSLAQWPTENVLQISHWILTAIRYTSMRSLFAVLIKRKFFNTSYLLLTITCDHLIRRFPTPPKRDTKLYRIVEG